MRRQLWAVVGVIAVFVAVAAGAVALSTAAWVRPAPLDPYELTPGGGLSLRTWWNVVLGYLIAAAALVLAGYFTTMLVRELLFLRRRFVATAGRSPTARGAATPEEAADPGVAAAAVRAARSIVFVSPHGVGRSVMAAAYLRELAGDDLWVTSLGVTPPDASRPSVTRRDTQLAMSMDRVHIDDSQPPRRATAANTGEADLVIRIGCGETCPVPSRTPVLDWDVPDPGGTDLVTSWTIRDDIKARIERLAADLGLAHRSLDLRDRVAPGQEQTPLVGSAAVPYPHMPETDAGRWFRNAEARLLIEVVVAPDRTATVNARGRHAPSVPIPWTVWVGAAESALQHEFEWRCLGGPALPLAQASIALVVDWLVSEGALRPLSEERRRELQLSGRTQRDIDHPFDQWPRGLAGEYPTFAEMRFAEEDFATWEVVPSSMLRVYPGLSDETPAWQAAART